MGYCDLLAKAQRKRRAREALAKLEEEQRIREDERMKIIEELVALQIVQLQPLIEEWRKRLPSIGGPHPVP